MYSPILKIHNVTSLGSGSPIVFAPGYGCDQQVWRLVAPAFTADHEILRFDYAGCGQSDPRSYDNERHRTLHGHADDLIAVCEATTTRPSVLVAHSVGTMIGILAACKRPDLFDSLVLLAPSPCYLNDGAYSGGFEPEDIDGLLDALESNFFAWSRMMAPVIMGNPDRPALAEELGESFCRLDPRVARHFAKVTFMADHRDDLAGLAVPTLVLQCQNDALAPATVGDFLLDAIPDCTLVRLEATGHCPHLSAPDEVIAAISAYLSQRRHTTAGATSQNDEGRHA